MCYKNENETGVRSTWTPTIFRRLSLNNKSPKRPGCLLRICKWFPVGFVILILIWSYYAYIVQFCYFTLIIPEKSISTELEKINNDGLNKTKAIKAILYAIIFNLIFLLMLWAYLSVTFTGFWINRCNLTPILSETNSASTSFSLCDHIDLNSNHHLLEGSDIPFSEVIQVPYMYKLPSQDLYRLENAREETEIANILNEYANSIINQAISTSLFLKYSVRPLKLCTVEGGPRYCDICKIIKPDRCHHCNTCGQCVLKMDHHCPWVNNCVQYSNYKQFILFLAYGSLLCLIGGVTTLPYFVSFWTNSSAYQIPTYDSPLPVGLQPTQSNVMTLETVTSPPKYTDTLKEFVQLPPSTRHANVLPLPPSYYDYGLGAVRRAVLTTRFNVLFLFFVALMFGISLGTLTSYHIFLVARNRTTLESFHAPVFLIPPRSATPNSRIHHSHPSKDNSKMNGVIAPSTDSSVAVDLMSSTKQDKDGFNLGSFKANFYQVFGYRALKWLLPVFSAHGNGVAFPSRSYEIEYSPGIRNVIFDRKNYVKPSTRLSSHSQNRQPFYTPFVTTTINNTNFPPPSSNYITNNHNMFGQDLTISTSPNQQQVLIKHNNHRNAANLTPNYSSFVVDKSNI